VTAPPPRRWNLARLLDVFAVAVILLVAYRLFIEPRFFAPQGQERAPAFSATSLDGSPYRLPERPGRVVFLDFWASWCTPCKLSLPLVEHFARTHPDVDVLAVNVGETPALAARYARENGLERVLFDPDERIRALYRIAGFPTLVVIDPAGNIRARWPGLNPAVEAAMGHARETLGSAHAALPAGFPAAEAATPERELTLSIEEDPSSLNTALNTPYGWLLAPLTQGYLFLVDERGRLVPDRALALPTRANGGISADGRTIVYRIRTGRWSDGAPFDARDVAFTAGALRNPATNVPDRSTVDQIESIDAPGPARLVVRLKAPSAAFVSSFLTLGANDPFAILPRHVAARYPNLNASSLDAHPVGLGPFRLVSWRRGEALEFEANPDYWRGRPALSRLGVRVLPNAMTRLFEVESGELDLTTISGPQKDTALSAGLAVSEATTNIVDYLQFNLRNPQLRDPAVRRAIAASLAREKLASAVYRGLEVPTDTGQLDPRLTGAERLPAYAPDAARGILAPRKLELELAIAGAWRSSSAAAVQIAGDLHRAGVNATIHSYSPGLFWGPKSAGGILERGRFDLALTSWSPSLDPDRSYLFGCAALPPAGGNAGAYCNRAFDELEARALRSYDPAVRAALYRRAHELLLRDLPIVPLGFERSAYAISKRFAHFRPNVLGRDYWNAWEFALQ
jgi:peptide/nickel transport system substrate-binding protein